MYLYDSGKTTYGDFETDGHFVVAAEGKDSLWYSISGATKIVYKGSVLHDQPAIMNRMTMDGTPDTPGVGKLRRWEETVKK